MAQHVMPPGLIANDPIELVNAKLADSGVIGTVIGTGEARTLIPWPAIRYVDIFDEE